MAKQGHQSKTRNTPMRLDAAAVSEPPSRIAPRGRSRSVGDDNEAALQPLPARSTITEHGHAGLSFSIS